MQVDRWSDQPGDSFATLTERLSAASVRRRWEAYRDIDWDDPAFVLDRSDPCWEAPLWDPLGASEWYRDQSAELRSEIGLYRTAAFLKVAIEFEGVLKEGLLRFASKLPNGHPAFRYVYHEITEEAQHSMMFQEFVNRSGFDPLSSPEKIQAMYRRIPEMGDTQPVMFFLAALSGEEAFDYVQRRTLAHPSTHPLLRRINQIHVTEEARHVSFARGYMRDVVPQLSSHELRQLRYQAPFVIQWTAGHIFGPEALARDWNMPDEVRSSLADHETAKEIQRDSTARVVSLCQELGLVDPRLGSVWSAFGVA